MMSKERELLERIVKADMVEYMRLMDEAEELLAQPEQEQEPEAWGYKKRVTYKPEGSEEEEIIPLYTSPPKREPLSEQVIAEQAVWATNSKHSFKDGVRWAEQSSTTRHALDSYWNQEAYQRGYAEAKLKLKRKPLSEDKLDALAEANITDEGIAGYYLGFRDAEKAHGITGGGK